MARTKNTSDKKQQLGQFMTPLDLCRKLISGYTFKDTDRILEPSTGDGGFAIAIIEKYLSEVYTDTNDTLISKINKVLCTNLTCVEIDPDLCKEFIKRVKTHFELGSDSNIVGNFYIHDFLTWESVITNKFDYIIGNPPFGGTIDVQLQDTLDKKYGNRYGKKIKKETYSFFIVKCVEEHLKDKGKMFFILSDTFLTIKTMQGVRRFLTKMGFNKIDTLDKFSEETLFPMVTLHFNKNDISDHITLNGNPISVQSMESTANYSWNTSIGLEKYFGGKTIGEFMIGSGGLTTGNNELFVRTIKNGKITEEYDFTFYDKPINLLEKIKNSRHNKLSINKIKKIVDSQDNGDTERDVRIIKREPIEIILPHPDYKSYNKSDGKLLFSVAKNVIYWKDNGDAVRTYKKNGRWHLHGMGGQKFYGKEGISWQLIATEIKPRYLPTGHILDNSGPILITKDGIEKEELYFIIGWLCSDLATLILKEVINHTRNIQAKDLERLPYPFWIELEQKKLVINETTAAINNIMIDGNYNLTSYKKTINIVFGNQHTENDK